MTSPTLGVVSLTLLATARSACCGVAVALAVLLAGFGSNWSAVLIMTVLVWAAGLSTRASIRKVCGVPGVTVPTAQVPLALLYSPWLGVAVMKVTPAGRRSCTVTLVAGSG